MLSRKIIFTFYWIIVVAIHLLKFTEKLFKFFVAKDDFDRFYRWCSTLEFLERKKC